MAVGFDVNPIQPVATQIKPPEAMSLADMVNMARGIQAYRSSAITLSKQEQENRERLALQDFFSKPENFQTDGRMDLNKVNAAVPQLAPLTGRDIVKNIAEVSQAQTAADVATRNLTTDARRVVSTRLGILGRAGVKEPSAYSAELDQLSKEYGDDQNMNKAVETYKNLISRMPGGDALPQIAIRAAQSIMTPTEQQAAFAPSVSMQNVGATLQPFAVTQQTGGMAPRVERAGAGFPISLPPGSRVQPTGRVDVNNNPTAYVYSADGTMVGEIPIPAGAPQGGAVAPPAGATAPRRGPVMPPVGPQAATGTVRRLPPGETAETYAAGQKIRNDARAAAQSVSDQLANNNEIVRIIDSGEIATGTGAETLRNLGGGYAVLGEFVDPSKAAVNYDKIGDFLARQTTNIAQTAGFNTDSARKIGEEQTGHKGWTPEALKSVARLNRSLATMARFYNMGITNVFNATKDPIAVAQYRDDWNNALSRDAARIIDVTYNRDQDKNGPRELAEEFGGVDSPRYKAALKNVARLYKLAGGK